MDVMDRLITVSQYMISKWLLTKLTPLVKITRVSGVALQSISFMKYPIPNL
jgi:hypothetical protein